MKRKKAMLKTGYFRIFGAIILIGLCAAPTFGVYEAWPGDHEIYATTPSISDGLVAYPGSYVNIFSGAIGDGTNTGILVLSGSSITVHGTGFVITSIYENATFDDPVNPTQIIPDPGWKGTLSGTYEGEGGAFILLFWSDIPINLVNTGSPGPEPITIDIKPGSDDNTINLGSNGVIPVAILSDQDFDATSVNPVNVSLAGSDVAVRGKGNLLAHEEDVNADGLMDLVVQVETENLDPGIAQDGAAILTIVDDDGQEQYQGSDLITIVPP